MGFSHANSDPDGRVVVQAYLRYLARHPATARRIGTVLPPLVAGGPERCRALLEWAARRRNVALRQGEATCRVQRAR